MEYAENRFIPYIEREFESCNHIDVEFDTYKKNSLKSVTREKRGKGIRRNFSMSHPPTNWAEFLHIDDNKTELFRFLSEITVSKVNSNKNVLCAYDTTAMCNNDYDHSEVSPCSHVKPIHTFLYTQRMHPIAIKGLLFGQ